VCNTNTGLCSACASDDDCSGSTPRCHESGACVACRDADDCVAEDDDLAFCTTAGRCVECLNDGHCDDVFETCSAVLGACAEPCSEPFGCTDPDDPICDDEIGYCVECIDDDDCEEDELCRGSECVE
jgi:hypothetical protein